MGQIVIHDPGNTIIEQLQARAAARGVPLEQAVQDILTAGTQSCEEKLWAETGVLLADMPAGDTGIERFIRENRDRR